jgi:hypothetical protein
LMLFFLFKLLLEVEEGVLSVSICVWVYLNLGDGTNYL